MDDPREQELAEAMLEVSAQQRREMTREERLAMDRRPRTAAVKHGLHLDLAEYMLCDQCQVAEWCPHHTPGADCALERDWAPRRRRRLCQALRDDGHDPDDYASLIDSVISAEIDLARVERYVRTVRAVRRKDGDHIRISVAQELPALRRDVRECLKELNLTPAAQAKLAAQRGEGSGGTNAMAMLVHESAAQASAEPVDAEFVAADDSGDGAGSCQFPVASDGNGGDGDDERRTGEGARATDDNDHGSMEGETNG